MDILMVRNVILKRVSIEGNINRRNARVGSGNQNGGGASYRKGRGRGRTRSCPRERRERRSAWESIQRNEKFPGRGKHFRSKGG